MLRSDLAEQYNPLYFLAALGAGGLMVSFFMYPMFLVKHPDTPMVTFDHLWPLLTGDNLLAAGLLALTLVAMLFFAGLHVRLLVWNIREYRLFRQTGAFHQLRNSNAEISLMAIPLTLAMSINVGFVLGAVFVPRLWSIVEWLFPFALVGYLLVGLYAMKILVSYFARVLANGGADFANNNSLAPMIAIFALAMVAVGLAAPAAMSESRLIQVVGIILSLFFFSAAALLAVIKLVLGFQSMMTHGVNVAASPSLWILIPILTLLGITWVRLSHGLHQGFDAHGSSSSLFVIITALLSMQILFGLIGWAVMRRLGYFRDYLHGNKGNAASFALVCPGVAFFVFGMFFISVGLVTTGQVAHLSPLYFALMLPFVLVQLKTVQVMHVLKRNILNAH